MQEVVVELIGEGANVDVKSIGGKAPIHYAALNNRKGIVDILLRSGADPSVPDGDGVVAAELTTSQDVRELLLRERGNVFIFDDQTLKSDAIILFLCKMHIQRHDFRLTVTYFSNLATSILKLKMELMACQY